MATLRRALILALVAVLHLQTADAGCHKCDKHWSPVLPPTPYIPPPPPPTEPAKPVVTQAPVTQTTIITQPIITQPIITQPIITQPIITQPIITQPIITQPIITQPIITPPVTTVTVTQPNGGGGGGSGGGNDGSGDGSGGSGGNGDGTITLTLLDDNNNPLTNLVVDILDPYGNVVDTDTTNGNGQVTFTLPPGNYIVAPRWPNSIRPSPPTDRFQVSINAGQNPGVTHVFTLAPTGPGIINISVVESTGMPMSGIQVQILDRNGNPVQVVTTNNNGQAQASLPAGYYDVRPILPNSSGTTLSYNVYVSPGGRQNVTFIVPNTPVPTQVTTGTIAGTVYSDVNINARPDPGEGLAGIPVTVYFSNGGQRQASTNTNGYYTFDNLPAGTYRIVVGEIPGVTVSVDARSRTVQLAPGATVIFNVQLINLPNTNTAWPTITPSIRPGTIIVRVFYDTNWNEIFDSNEVVAPNIPIALVNSNENLVASSRTSSTGVVTFDNVPIGTYTILADLTDVSGVEVTAAEGIVEMSRGGERFSVDFAIQLYNEQGAISGQVGA